MFKKSKENNILEQKTFMEKHSKKILFVGGVALSALSIATIYNYKTLNDKIQCLHIDNESLAYETGLISSEDLIESYKKFVNNISSRKLKSKLIRDMKQYMDIDIK